LLSSAASPPWVVRATATDALNHSLRPQVVHHVCAERTTAVHESNLTDLDAKYADLDEAVDHLRVPMA
jgi:maleamate amidohydrolase